MMITMMATMITMKDTLITIMATLTIIMAINIAIMALKITIMPFLMETQIISKAAVVDHVHLFSSYTIHAGTCGRALLASTWTETVKR